MRYKAKFDIVMTSTVVDSYAICSDISVCSAYFSFLRYLAM
jgi:hypothetical protein